MSTQSALARIGDVLLDPGSSDEQLRACLTRFTRLCSEAGGIAPAAAFDAWAGDSFLQDGVAIAPQAAAHCAHDYYRSVIYLRGVHAAIEQLSRRFPGEVLHILYAGCGPYATLLLPLLPRYQPDVLSVCLLDIHPESLASVARLLDHFHLDRFAVHLQQADACRYVHPEPLHLIISETMQKSLEQEPQFAVTAQLAPQLHQQGIWIPQKIEVGLCLTPTDSRSGPAPYPLGTMLALTPANAAGLLQSAVHHAERDKWELSPVLVEIPSLEDLASYRAALTTRIQVYGGFCLEQQEAEITLPQACTDLSPLRPGDHWEISYQLGNYPRFNVRQKTDREKA